jgi:polyisoprenoid-binding protein YceI
MGYWQKRIVCDPVHTQANFTAKHREISIVRGVFTESFGEIELNSDTEEGLTFDNMVDCYFGIIANSLSTGNSIRDAHIKSSEFLDVDNFSHIMFHGDSFEKINDTEYIAYGNLHMIGRVERVSAKINIVYDENQDIDFFKVTANIKRSDWNMIIFSDFFMVGDEIEIEVTTEVTTHTQYWEN